MKLQKKMEQRIKLIRSALKDGALDSQDVFNHIIKRIDGTVVTELWGSYYKMSIYLDGVELEDMR